jgi:outer membrane protein assembly factor BamD
MGRAWACDGGLRLPSRPRLRERARRRPALPRLLPAEPDAAYAQYLLALSYYDQIDDIGRDQGLTFQALQALRAVIENYPDSPYAADAW